MKGLEVFLYKALGLLYEMHPLLTPFPYQGTSNVQYHVLNFALQYGQALL